MGVPSLLPDGSGMVYGAGQLMLRRWGSLDPVPVSGGEQVRDGGTPVVSPSGGEVASITTSNELKVVPLGGGIVRTLATGAWRIAAPSGAAYRWATMDFDLQPTLKGELVHLRPLRVEDWDALYAVASDPAIWEQHPEPNRHEEAVFREFFRAALESGGALVVEEATSGRVIGSSRYYGYDPDLDEVEIGWTFLARSHWGGAYNREMKRLMLEHAFRFVGSVILRIGPDNVRSQRAAERVGAVLAGSRPDARGVMNHVYRFER